MHSPFRYGRFGSAVLLLTMPVVVPVFMLTIGVAAAFEFLFDNVRKDLGPVARYVVTGKIY